MQIDTQKKHRIIAIALSAIVALMGAIVVFGWHSHLDRLVQALPASAPMQYNTALCFIFSGLGMIALIYERRALVLFAGVFIMAVGLAVLIQYVCAVNLGIDELFMKSYLVVKTSHPGRSAPNSALCFFVTGFIFCLSALFNRPWKLTWMYYLALLLVANAGSVLLGYITGAESSYGWGSLTRMAVHTAVAFLMLGFSFMAISWKNPSAHWLSTLVFILGILLSLQVLQVLNQVEDQKVREDFRLNAIDRSEALRREFENIYRTTMSFVAFYEGSQNVERDEFTAFQQRVMEKSYAVQAVEWLPAVPAAQKKEFEKEIQSEGFKGFYIKELNAKKRAFEPVVPREIYYPVTYVEPFKENSIALGFDHGSESQRMRTMETAIKTNQLRSTPPIVLFRETQVNQKGLIVFFPIYRKTADSSIQLKGFLSVVMRAPQFIETAFSYLTPEPVAVSLFDVTNKPAQLLFETKSMPGSAKLDALEGLGYVYRSKIQFAGRSYALVFAPAAALGNLNWLTWAIFFAILIVSLTIALFLHKTILQNREIFEAREKLTRSNNQLESLSVTDPLTELLNRRGLEKELIREANFSHRYGRQAYVVLIDLDDFKPINTNYGHNVGDFVLQQISAKIKSAIRPTDFAGRIGGDEFLVLLPHLNSESEGMDAAERIRSIVGESEFQTSEDKKIKVTCSAGITVLKAEMKLDQVIAEAGKALQQSKAGGKNKLSLI